MKRNIAGLTIPVAIRVVLMWAAPSVFPLGTTIYHPDQAWNGYNNNAGGPVRVLPGGIAYGSMCSRAFGRELGLRTRSTGRAGSLMLGSPNRHARWRKL